MTLKATNQFKNKLTQLRSEQRIFFEGRRRARANLGGAKICTVLVWNLHINALCRSAFILQAVIRHFFNCRGNKHSYSSNNIEPH